LFAKSLSAATATEIMWKDKVLPQRASNSCLINSEWDKHRRVHETAPTFCANRRVSLVATD